MLACVGNQSKSHAHSIKNTRKTKTNTYIATNGGLSAKAIKQMLHVASKTREDQEKHTNIHIATHGGRSAKPNKVLMHIAQNTENPTKPHESQRMVACL